MPNDRDKLLEIMNSLESDYKSGKISSEKYRYFRSKYEDKLNSIDAQEATRRIRSMQGKPSSNNNSKKRRRKPAREKKQQEDLVQKYIVDPKKDDARYSKKKNSSMDGGTFKLVVLLFLVIGFTAGVAFGIFNLDMGEVSDTGTVAIVLDTAFPDITEDIPRNTTTQSDFNTTNDNPVEDNTETTTDDSDQDTDTQSSDTNYPSNQGSQSSSDNTPSDQGGQSSSDSGSSDSGSSDSGSQEE